MCFITAQMHCCSLLQIIPQIQASCLQLIDQKTLILNIICQASQQRAIQARYPPCVSIGPYKHVFAFLCSHATVRLN